jgi:hypothetical protein
VAEKVRSIGVAARAAGFTGAAMGTNQERDKISTKAPLTGDLGQESTAPPMQTAAACEPTDDMIRIVDRVEIDSVVEDLPRLDPRVRAHLARLVRSTYAVLVEEPVPERFLSLLEELERAEERNN